MHLSLHACIWLSGLETHNLDERVLGLLAFHSHLTIPGKGVIYLHSGTV